MSEALLPDRVVALRERLSLSQVEMGRRLGTSAMAVSRWERGSPIPTRVLLQLGILGGKNDCWFFWNLAGLTLQDVQQCLPMKEARSLAGIPVVQVVSDRREKEHGPKKLPLVAVPVLPLHAAASREKGSSAYQLDEATAEAVLAAPRRWCPNPDHTICLRVTGDSMEPLLQEGYFVVVDRKQNDLKSLEGRIVVVQHKDFGLVVSRLFRLEGRHMLVSDNRAYDPIAFDAGWRITGKVLWWVGGPMIAAEERVP